MPAKSAAARAPRSSASAPKEAHVQKRILGMLRKRGAWAYKTTGGMGSTAGAPDILCCYRGLFLAIEVKRPGKLSTISDLQRRRLQEIAQAKGLAYAVDSVESAEEILDFVDRQLSGTAA